MFAACQVLRLSPRGGVFQFCGAQRDLKLQSAVAAALENVMPAPVVEDGANKVAR